MPYLGPSLRRALVRERPARRLALALAASLALNALAGWLLVVAGAFRIAAPAVPSRVALAPVGAKDWEANRAIRDEGRATPPRPPDETPAGPVVALPPRDDGAPPDEEPRDARRSAERNQKVERETVSRHAGTYPKLAAKPQVAVPGRPQAGESGDAEEAKRGTEGRRGERLALAPAPFGERAPGEGGEGGRRARGKLAPDLSLGADTAAKVLAGPNLDGFREGLDEGEETLLNARSFKFATYMNQLRDEIGQEWIPRVRAAARDRDPDASMFFYRDRTVALGITLDKDGRVTNLSVLETSNVDFFDRIALDSVQAAQPFPNPPRAMFGEGDEARLAFTFTLYSGDSRPRLRWFRGGR